MITRVLITASCALLAHAHALHIINPRQGPPAPTTTLPPAATATDAVPLDQIVPNSVRETDTTTIPVPTPTAGSTPSGIPNAPTLPSLANWAQMQSGYPSPDPAVPLDVTNPQVVQWVQDVQGSGVQIPNIAPYKYNLTGQNCADPDNVARRANWESDGWWTCGHYTRSTDIVECTRPKVWGSSFDDGPSDNDGKLLGYLGQQNIKTTFFAVGTAIYWRPWILQAEYIAGHQIAVHTWSHSPLTTLSNEAIIAQLGWSKKIIKDVLGVTPLYFRPPYGDIDDRVRAIARAMQLTPVMWTVTGTLEQPFAFDTFDTLVPGGSVTAVQSVTQFQLLLEQADQFGKGFLVLSHDLFWQQVDLSIGYFLPSAVARGYQLTPVYDCAGQTLVNAYAETRSGNNIPGGSTGNGGSSSGTSGPGQPTSRSNGPTGTSTSSSGSPSQSGAPDSAMPLLDSLTTVAAFAVAGVLSYMTTL